MTIKDNLETQLKEAVLARNSRRCEILRTLGASLKNQEIALGRPLNDKEIGELFFKEIKKRQEAFELYRKANRQDLANQEQEEIKAIREFLPPTLSESELEKLVIAAIKEVDARDKSGMGKVIGAVLSKIETPVDKGHLAKLILEKLNG